MPGTLPTTAFIASTNGVSSTAESEIANIVGHSAISAVKFGTDIERLSARKNLPAFAHVHRAVIQVEDRKGQREMHGGVLLDGDRPADG